MKKKFEYGQCSQLVVEIEQEDSYLWIDNMHYLTPAQAIELAKWIIENVKE